MRQRTWDRVSRARAATVGVTRKAIRYDALVHARSDLEMAATVAQDRLTSGAKVTARARLSQYESIPVDGARVLARITFPDGAASILPLAPRGDGVYEVEFTAPVAGVYTIRIHAEGTMPVSPRRDPPRPFFLISNHLAGFQIASDQATPDAAASASRGWLVHNEQSNIGDIKKNSLVMRRVTSVLLATLFLLAEASYAQSGKTWVQLPGFAKDIGVGGDGSLWIIGTNPSGTAHDFGFIDGREVIGKASREAECKYLSIALGYLG